MKYLNYFLLFNLFLSPLILKSQEIFLDENYRIDSYITGSDTISFSYDPVGNRLSKEVTTSGVIIYVKAFLQGCYNTGSGLMNDDLRSLAYLPTDEPYTALGYNHVDGGGEKMNSVAFTTTGNNAVVDWFVIELRDKNDPTIIIATQSVVIQADGDIVSQDGISPVIFPNIPVDSYYVSLHHRNHLGVRTANPVLLKGDAGTTPVDFSNPATATHGSDAQKNINGVMEMWGGNAKASDDYVRATPRIFPPPSLDSDITHILDDGLGGNPNATLHGYHTADVNMDGKVRMTPLVFPPPGTPSDATFILDQVLNGDPNVTKQEQN